MYDFLIKNKRRILTFIIFSIFTVSTLLLIPFFGLDACASLNSPIPVRLQIISYAYIVLHIAFCIFCRIKKQRILLKAFFLYQFVGVIVFVIYFAFRIAGYNSPSQFISNAFFSWTLWTRPIAYLIAPFIGVSESLRRMLAFLVSVFITGQAFQGIKKDIDFENKIKEKRSIEINSNERF